MSFDVERIHKSTSKVSRFLKRKSRRPSPETIHDLRTSIRTLERAEENPRDSDVMSATMAKAIQLCSELNRPARLSRKNLHPYRLKVKELRNVLQLSRPVREPEFVKKLAEVKDAIGEWHDWEELSAIAGQTLDHGKACRMAEYLRSTGNAKYQRALLSATNLRRNYLKPAGHEDRSHESRLDFLSVPVLNATAAVAIAANGAAFWRKFYYETQSFVFVRDEWGAECDGGSVAEGIGFRTF